MGLARQSKLHSGVIPFHPFRGDTPHQGKLLQLPEPPFPHLLIGWD